VRAPCRLPPAPCEDGAYALHSSWRAPIFKAQRAQFECPRDAQARALCMSTAPVQQRRQRPSRGLHFAKAPPWQNICDAKAKCARAASMPSHAHVSHEVQCSNAAEQRAPQSTDPSPREGRAISVVAPKQAGSYIVGETQQLYGESPDGEDEMVSDAHPVSCTTHRQSRKTRKKPSSLTHHHSPRSGPPPRL